MSGKAVGGSLLRRPGFRWLWLGQTLLFAGVQFWFVAVTWLMLQRTGSGTYLALEFGTRPIDQVLAALRADAWLHAVPDRPTPDREAIRRQVRDAFLIDSPAWRTATYGRCADVVLRACRGLGG